MNQYSSLIKKQLKKIFPHFYKWWKDQRTNPGKKVINRILNKKDIPVNYDSDAFFKNLQSQYLPPPQYGYDPHSTWKRGTERAKNLLDEFIFLRDAGLKILEVGSGDSMPGVILSNYGHDISLADMDDWRDKRARSLNFIKTDLCKPLPLPDNSFDFIYSYNTFEHLYDPVATLQELVRICKKGGQIYLEFAPLYSSPWGLHAYQALYMPYPQFLFSEEFCLRMIKEIGNFDIGRKMDTIQPLNKWTVAQFEHLWQKCGCEIVSYRKSMHYSYLKVIRRYPKAFQGRGLTYTDVTTHTIRIALKK